MCLIPIFTRPAIYSAVADLGGLVHSQFPLCNGTHVKHNKETGDNVGPLIVSK